MPKKPKITFKEIGNHAFEVFADCKLIGFLKPRQGCEWEVRNKTWNLLGIVMFKPDVAYSNPEYDDRRMSAANILLA
jgi:hypothetical protein